MLLLCKVCFECKTKRLSVVPTSGGWHVLPGALDLQEDGVGVVGKEKTSNQTKYLRNNHKSASENCHKNASKCSNKLTLIY